MVLQIVPYLVTLAYERLEHAASTYLGSKVPVYSSSRVLDVLLSYALQRREGIWKKSVKTRSMGYALSKNSIYILQKLCKTPNAVGDSLKPLLHISLFGTKEQMERLPAACRERKFVELVYSVAGGEFEGLHKGAVGYTKDKKEFTIVAFASTRIDPTKEAICEWEFSPKIHDQVAVHFVNEEGGELAIHHIPVCELVPVGNSLSFDDLARDVKLESLVKLIIDLQPRKISFSVDTLADTLKVKLMKVLMIVLKGDKALCRAIASEELIKVLLDTSLNYPKTETSRSLLITELAVEELRRRASQSDSHELWRDESERMFVLRKGSKLLVASECARIALRIKAHLNLDRVPCDQKLRFVHFDRNIDKQEYEGKLVVLPNAEEGSEVWSVACAGWITCEPLQELVKKLPEGVLEQVTIIQLYERDLKTIDGLAKEVEGITDHMLGVSPEDLLGEYLKMKAPGEVKGNNVKDLLREIMSSASAVKKEETQMKTQKEIFDLLLNPSDKRDNIFKEGQEYNAAEERATYSKEYEMLFKQVYEKGGSAKPETYSNLLYDLHIFYTRHILLNLLIHSKEKIASLPIELYKRLLTFLLIYAAEADLMKYAVQHRIMSRRVNKLLSATLKRADGIQLFITWTHERVKDTVYLNKMFSYSVCSSPQSKLEEVMYLPFITRYVKSILRVQREQFILNPQISLFMEDMLAIIIATERLGEKHQAMGMLRIILGTAAKMLQTLPCEALERILGSESIKVLSLYYNKAGAKNSPLWKIGNEILLKANALYRSAANLHGEGIQTYYTKNAFSLFIGSEVMKEFPSMRLIGTYLWGKAVRKEIKDRYTVRVVTPTPLFDTQYCIMISDPQAESLEVESRKHSHRIATTSIDKDGNAELPQIDSEECKFVVDSNRFYLNFPCDTYTTYGFGSNEGGRLGLRDTSSCNAPTAIPELATVQVKSLVSSGRRSLVFSSKEVLYYAGRGEGRLGSDTSNFLQFKSRAASGIIAANSCATIYYDPKANSLFAIGKNPERMFVSSSSLLSSEESIKPNEAQITQVSISDAHCVVLYNERNVYGCPGGRKELFGNFIESSSVGFCQIRFGEEIDRIYKVLALNCGTIILCTSLISGMKELYSFGLLGSPVLGQNDHQIMEEYGRLEYAEYIEFVDLAGAEQMAAAITSNGELFTWGIAPNGALGLRSLEGFALELAETPTKVEALSEYQVLEVSVGLNHMLALVSDRANPKSRKVFGFGDNSKGQLGHIDLSTNFCEIPYFDAMKPYRVCAGHEASFVCCGEDIKGVVHKDTICCVNGVTPVKDIIYFRNDSETGFVAWCKDCASYLPAVVMATRFPIEKMEERDWVPLDDLFEEGSGEVKLCTECRKQVEGAIFYSAVSESTAVLCEKCFLRTPSLFEPVIFYRLASATMRFKYPLRSLKDYFDPVADSLVLTVSSGYKYLFPPSIIRSISSPKLEEYLAELSAFDTQYDYELLDLLNEYLMEKDTKIETISLKNDISLPYKKKVNLVRYPVDLLKKRARMLIKFNKIVRKAIEYIDFNSKSESEDDLYSCYNRAKAYVLTITKDQMMRAALMEEPKSQGRANVDIERSKAFALKMSGRVDHSGQYTVFGQLWRQLKDQIHYFKKEPRGEKYPFNVKFKGEGGIDAGGLFRETIDQLCEELQSSILPLFVPTANNKTGFGEYREKYTINPSATQEIHLEMFEFLGALIGMSLRLSHVLPLNLNSLFWKRLSGDVIDKTDLTAMDAYCVKCLTDIINIDKKGVDEETFSQVIDETFTTSLSDGSQCELMKGGKTMKVTFENRKEYAELVEKRRLEEGLPQLKAICNGLHKIVPQALVRLYSWRELENNVCGKPTFKVEALKKITSYAGCGERDEFIQFFWQALEEFSDEERSLYLRFVWGRSRMPTYCERYRHYIHIKRSANPDGSLPVGHTCGFQLDLPKYSSVDKTKDKVLYAIRFCQSIDADRDNFETWEDYHI